MGQPPPWGTSRRSPAGPRGTRRSIRPSCLVVALAVVCVVPVVADVPAGASPSSSPHAASALVTDVDPFIGTGFGPGQIGAIGTFPGADVPFGMVQWSPDTPSTSGTLAASGGYYYPLDTINGFSLTHLSGAGCLALEDFPIMPYPGAVTASPVADPSRYESTFSHQSESATPGYYAVTLADGVRVELTVTDRSGIGRFIFPPGVTPSILIDPEDSEGGFTSGQLSAAGDDGLVGSAVAGKFCDAGGTYTVHMDAKFETPFRAVGTWETGTLSPSSRTVNGSAPGIYATFAPAAHGATTVTMKVGLSYTSGADAAANLTAEQHGWSFEAVRGAASATWNRAISRIDVGGGTEAQRRVFLRFKGPKQHCLVHLIVEGDRRTRQESSNQGSCEVCH